MKETPNHGLRYPEPSDPDTLAAYWENLAKDAESALNAIDLSQLVADPGGADDGKLVIVKDGAAAYKAMSGDGTIDENGSFQLGSKVVGTTELGDKAVTTGKIDDGAVTDAKLASSNNAVYRTLLDSRGYLTEKASAAKYLLGSRQQANPNMDASGSASGSFVGSAIRPPDFIYLDDADYAVSGKTTKLRLRVQVAVNPTKAALKFTFGLYPITPEGSAKTLDFVAGELVTGSSAVVNEPAALGISQTASGDFNVPADGLYAICVTTSAALTENSAVVCAAQLQVRHT